MHADEELRAAFQRHTMAHPHHVPGACPEPEAIYAALRGAGDPATLEGIARCARCAAIALAADALAADPLAADTRAADTRAPPLRRARSAPWLRALAATGLLAAVLLGVQALRPHGPEPLRGGAIGVMPAPGAVLTAAPGVFRWQVAPTAICRVEVRDARGTLVWQSSGVRGGEALLAPAPGWPRGTYLWSVRCAAETLGPFDFRLQ